MSLQLTRSCIMSSISAPLYERIQRAIASIPSPHLIPTQPGEESFSSQADAKERYQNWAFTQGFAIVVEKNDTKNGVYVLECTRHKKKSQIQEINRKVTGFDPLLLSMPLIAHFAFALSGKKRKNFGYSPQLT